MTKPNDPAFNGLPGSGSPGLTKREYFASQALRGMCEWDAKIHKHNLDAAGNSNNIVKGCIILADALIAELNKSK